MEQIILQAKTRKLLGKKVKTLRAQKQIPAVLYGQNFNSTALSLDKSEFFRVLKQAGEATLVDLDVEGSAKHKILIRDIQRDPVRDEILHIDLYKVNMNKEIQTEIPLHFIGISPAVEEKEGNFITNKDTIKVECLPDKLVSVIEVDISVLQTFEDLIHVKDLKTPEGIEVLEEPDDIVAQVTAPMSEDELKAMEEETAATTEKAQIENIEAEAEKEKVAKETEAKEGEEPEKEAAPEQKQEPTKNE